VPKLEKKHKGRYSNLSFSFQTAIQFGHEWGYETSINRRLWAPSGLRADFCH
jgi:hypothetical protein